MSRLLLVSHQPSLSSHSLLPPPRFPQGVKNNDRLANNDEFSQTLPCHGLLVSANVQVWIYLILIGLLDEEALYRVMLDLQAQTTFGLPAVDPCQPRNVRWCLLLPSLCLARPTTAVLFSPSSGGEI